MRSFLPVATLLGTAFLLGCQEQASSPIGPEGPQFDQPNSMCVGHCPHGGGGDGDDPLIAVGEALFFGEDFNGNGRTCGTCHRAENNLTIDVAFIATLPATDLLFITEFNPGQQTMLGVDLPAFDPAFPNVPAFEAPDLMKDRGLILENIGGFDVDDGTGLLFNPPVFRAPPSLFNLAFTAPYGLSGDIPDLRQFSTGAVIQHFPKTLARSLVGDPGMGVPPDFRLPTESELDALEAFMLSLESPADGNFKVSGPNSILSTAADPRAQDTNRPEVAGRDLFFSVGCTSCHRRNKVFSGGNRNTGVEAFDKASGSPTPTTDLGIGGTFQTPGLFGLRKAAFFHNNAVVGLEASVAFYVSAEFQASPTGGAVDPNMSAADILDIVAFLVAISNE